MRTTSIIDDKGRECSKCKEYKDWSNFSHNPGGTRNRSSRCKECVRVVFRKHYQDNTEDIRKRCKKWQDTKGKAWLRKWWPSYKDTKTAGIYMITTRANNRYIGESSAIEFRINSHRAPSNKVSPIVQEGFKEYTILEVVPDREERLIRERYYIKKLKPELNQKWL